MTRSSSTTPAANRQTFSWAAHWPQIAWVLLDWAASAFSTISIVLVVAYVEKIVFADNAWGVPGGVVWAWTLAAGILVSALAAPWLAAWADRRQAHKQALLLSILVGSIACLFLAAVPPTARLAIVVFIATASVAFDMAAIFIGSLLPRLATGQQADRLSAAGFACGYAGGAIALVLATTLVAVRESLGLTMTVSLRLSFAVMGVWWLIFSLPAVCTQMGIELNGQQDGESSDTSANALFAFARSLFDRHGVARSLGQILVGAMLVLGAVQTAISQFSSLALEEFHLDATALVRLVLLVQVIALPGALFIGWLSVRVSRRGSLFLCLAGWAIVLLLAWIVRTPAEVTALAVLLALVLGGLQSALRATVSSLTRAGRSGVTIGLLQVGTKLAGFLASVLFGSVYAATGHPRSGLIVLLVQLLIGAWILLKLTGRSTVAGDDCITPHP